MRLPSAGLFNSLGTSSTLTLNNESIKELSVAAPEGLCARRADLFGGGALRNVSLSILPTVEGEPRP